MSDVQFGYQPPRNIDDGLWEVRGEWKNKFGRRMTVIVLRGGQVVVHNAIRLHDDELDWLARLGDVQHIIAPNTFHCSDAGWMAKKFSGARLYVPAEKLKTFRQQGLRPLDVNTEFPVELNDELVCLPIQGTRISEAAFIHTVTKTLILCDMAFNMENVFTGFEAWMMRWNKVGGQFGPSRLTKLVFTKNLSGVLQSYRKLLAADFDRVIVNHGAVLESGGKTGLRAGIEKIFGPI